MSSALRFVPTVLLSFLSLATFGSAQTPLAPIQTYPQIVRVSLVEGDVRVSRGKEGQKATGAAWEKAAVDLPLEAGFSLVTGADGRAEIEFEDASTVYLAENSVLVFNDLSSTNGLPRTDLGLLSGTMTLDVKPMGPGEWFSVKTPTDGFTVRYPNKTFLRVNSYLDGMSLTSIRPATFHMNGAQAVNTRQGETVTFHSGRRDPAANPEDAAQFAAWDSWVSGHVTEREEAMQAAMKDSGLSAPIPGLAEMNQRGTFYPCAPYGTCWEPKDQVEAASGSSGSSLAQAAQARPGDPLVRAVLAQQTVSVTALQQGGGSQPNVQVKTNGARSGLLPVNYDNFPCSPWWDRSLLRRDPATGLFVINPYPYRWAVCHTGSWIERRHRYVWVVGTKRHHHHPVHWVKTGKTVGYVPIHPRDVKGQTPLNLKNGLLHPDKNGGVERIAYADGEKLRLLDEAPKEFRRDEFPLLERSEAPHPVAFHLADRGVRGTVVDNKVATAAHPAGVPVTFDHKSQSFMVAQTVQHGSATRTVAEPIGGRGSSVQAYSHSSSGGGYSGGSSSASRGSYSGGGSSSGGGGASHASSSASSAPAASSGGGGAAASSGGGGKR